MNGRGNKVAQNAKHAKHTKRKKQKRMIEKVEEKSTKKETILEPRKDDIKVIEQELSQGVKEKKKIPADELKKLNNRIFKNMIMSIAIILYLLFINIGALNIETTTYIMDLKVFSILLIVLTILVFEVSYKKDSGILCIHGIEILILAIITLILPTWYSVQNENYGIFVTALLIAFTIYYMIKSAIIYYKQRTLHLKKASDINEIIKKK